LVNGGSATGERLLVEPIMNEAASPFVSYEAGVAQHAEVLGDGTLGDVQLGRQRVHASRMLLEHLDDADARADSQDLDQPGEIVGIGRRLVHISIY
jgi:hypothetical protein